jgi:ABC-2 type transport system permease protein
MTTETESVLNHDMILAAREGLLPVRDSGWLGGFGNMLRKELGQWWGTRTWWLQTLIWVLILNGVTTIVAQTESMASGEMLQEVVRTFLPMSVGAVGIGTVITVQGAIVGEKQLGTAAWVMSKPASRSAFILAKICAYVIGFWITAIIIPSTLFVIEMRYLIPARLDLTPFLYGMALAALSQLFYLTLTLMLGTFFNGRGAVAGIGISLIMAGLLLKSLIPLPVMIFTPWLLQDLSPGLALGDPMPSIWFVPILATSIWIIIMTVAALWRFGREEF